MRPLPPRQVHEGQITGRPYIDVVKCPSCRKDAAPVFGACYFCGHSFRKPLHWSERVANAIVALFGR